MLPAFSGEALWSPPPCPRPPEPARRASGLVHLEYAARDPTQERAQENVRRIISAIPPRGPTFSDSLAAADGHGHA